MKLIPNLPYYPESISSKNGYIASRCRLDLRLPEDAADFPTVVWFHGGGIENGEKHFIDLDDDGIAQVAVNYRLLPGGATADDCIADAAAAVAWTLDHIAEYGGNPDKVFVSGHSAGAYLTMMIGMDPARLALWNHTPRDLAGLAPISGQATMHFNVRNFSGDTDPRFLPKLGPLAPLSLVANDVPPVLCVCGQPPYELPARAEENRLLVASLRATGHKDAWYVECPLCDHGRVNRVGPAYIRMLVRGELPEQA